LFLLSPSYLLDAFGYGIPSGVNRNTIGRLTIDFAQELKSKLHSHLANAIVSLQMDGGIADCSLRACSQYREKHFFRQTNCRWNHS
jgi:hypothetical protein